MGLFVADCVRVQARRRHHPDRLRRTHLLLPRRRQRGYDDDHQCDDNGAYDDLDGDDHDAEDDNDLASERWEHYAPGSVKLGRTVLLAPRTKKGGCVLGPNPDRRSSPGAYYSGLTKAVLCASTFRTGAVRHVTDSVKHQVEIEYGMAPKPYGRTLEIDHIVSLELGGSNDIANLFPEKAKRASGLWRQGQARESSAPDGLRRVDQPAGGTAWDRL